MPVHNVLRWPDGRGWLILSGGVDVDNEARALALARMSADGSVASVSIGGRLEASEQTLEDLEDLGAPSGYVVDTSTEDDPTITRRLADAGMIIIEDGGSVTEIRSALLGAAVDGMQEAYENGAIILVEGLSAMAFGEWLVRDDGSLADGLQWVGGALIAPGVTNVAEWARSLLQAQPAAYAVGLGVGSALALGPDGQIETWGKGEVTIALGPNFARSQREASEES